MNPLSKKESFYKEKFENVSLESEIVAGKEFEECEFVKCSFLGTTFSNCKFLDCKFGECAISAIKVTGCKISNTTFVDSKVIGIDWTKAARIDNMSFDVCQINYSNFSYLKMQKLRLTDCIAQEADFVETDLTEAVMTGTDFAGARFGKTNLTKADLRSAKNYFIDTKTNILTKASFTFPEAMGLLASLDVTVEY